MLPVSTLADRPLERTGIDVVGEFLRNPADVPLAQRVVGIHGDEGLLNIGVHRGPQMIRHDSPLHGSRAPVALLSVLRSRSARRCRERMSRHLTPLVTSRFWEGIVLVARATAAEDKVWVGTVRCREGEGLPWQPGQAVAAV